MAGPDTDPEGADALHRAAARLVLAARRAAELPPELQRAVLGLEHALFLDAGSDGLGATASEEPAGPSARHLRAVQ